MMVFGAHSDQNYRFSDHSGCVLKCMQTDALQVVLLGTVMKQKGMLLGSSVPTCVVGDNEEAACLAGNCSDGS